MTQNVEEEMSRVHREETRLIPELLNLELPNADADDFFMTPRDELNIKVTWLSEANPLKG